MELNLILISLFCLLFHEYQVDKLREELERSQATVGKAQIGQEKTQSSLDKVQSELDQLQERYERQSAEMRRVSVDYICYARVKQEARDGISVLVAIVH